MTSLTLNTNALALELGETLLMETFEEFLTTLSDAEVASFEAFITHADDFDAIFAHLTQRYPEFALLLQEKVHALSLMKSA
jgi:hypothetical protein